MNTWKKSAIRWQMVAGYLAVIAVLTACATSGATSPTATPIPTEEPAALLRLENGAIEFQQENGNWVPVAGETTFEIVGELENTDPWMVTGNTFATREWTQIDEGLEAGDPVRVKGMILADATWLAYSIEQVKEEQASPTIVLLGEVTSIAPWAVNGITLNVTSDTLISEGIEPGMIVQVNILLLEDGTWEILKIVALDDFIDVPGCATVMATVSKVNGREVQLVGWPIITLDEDVRVENDEGVEGALSKDQVVLVVVCSPENEQIQITHMIILNVKGDEMPAGGGGKT